MWSTLSTIVDGEFPLPKPMGWVIAFGLPPTRDTPATSGSQRRPRNPTLCWTPPKNGPAGAPPGGDPHKKEKKITSHELRWICMVLCVAFLPCELELGCRHAQIYRFCDPIATNCLKAHGRRWKTLEDVAGRREEAS